MFSPLVFLWSEAEKKVIEIVLASTIVKFDHDYKAAPLRNANIYPEQTKKES